jgi:hypothetical protein
MPLIQASGSPDATLPRLGLDTINALSFWESCCSVLKAQGRLWKCSWNWTSVRLLTTFLVLGRTRENYSYFNLSAIRWAYASPAASFLMVRICLKKAFCLNWYAIIYEPIQVGASTKCPLLRTSLPYITVLVCVIPCIIYSWTKYSSWENGSGFHSVYNLPKQNAPVFFFPDV